MHSLQQNIKAASGPSVRCQPTKANVIAAAINPMVEELSNKWSIANAHKIVWIDLGT